MITSNSSNRSCSFIPNLSQNVQIFINPAEYSGVIEANYKIPIEQSKYNTSSLLELILWQLIFLKQIYSLFPGYLIYPSLPNFICLCRCCSCLIQTLQLLKSLKSFKSRMLFILYAQRLIKVKQYVMQYVVLGMYYSLMLLLHFYFFLNHLLILYMASGAPSLQSVKNGYNVKRTSS